MKNTIVSQAVYGVLDRAMNGAMYQAVKGPVNGVVLRDFQMTVIRIVNQAVNRALSAWKDLTAPRPVARGAIPVSGV